MSEHLLQRLDPQLARPIRLMLGIQQPMDFSDIPAARAASKEMMQNMKGQLPVYEDVVSDDYLVPGPEGAPEVPVRVYRPKDSEGQLPALFWIHGGGYMFGDMEQEDLVASPITLAGNCVTISVDYRLAPENPYPAPIEDCYAALKWTAANTEELGIDPGSIAIGGGSAGGGLAAGLALLVRDRAEIDIMYQFLIYPMIDDRTTEPASETVRDALFWTRMSNYYGWRSYLGCEPGGDDIPGYAAAARATDLAGLAPAYIAVGDQDLFSIEDTLYAARLIEAGVSTEIHVYPGGCHAFDMMVPDADVSQRFTGDFYRALKRALHGIC
jgi:acetyl esterase/lipase